MARKRERTLESVDLNAAVERVLEILERPLKYEKVTMDMALAEPAPRVNADRVQVEQIIMNLLNNALEAMHAVAPGARRLRLATSSSGGKTTLSITDSGPGLVPDQVERVFDNFFTTKATGLGVGLSICRTLAEAHGGRLWAESAPGAGATFKLTLPESP